MARRQSRPLDPAITTAMLRATRRVVGDVGVRAASIEKISRAAGCGKPSIYLRWSNRVDLILDAIHDLRRDLEVAEGVTARARLVASLEDDDCFLVTGPESLFIRAVMFSGDAALSMALQTDVLTPRRERLWSIIVQELDGHGRVRPMQIETAVGLLAAGTVADMSSANSVGAEALARRVDHVIDGIATAHSGGPI